MAADKQYAAIITDEMASSAKARGTGIAKRSPAYVEQKMAEGKSVIALTKEGEWVGFCYIEVWEHNKFVANSGLIVAPPYRKTGVAKAIKKRIFELSREKYPASKIFGLTTGSSSSHTKKTLMCLSWFVHNATAYRLCPTRSC